MQKRPDTHQAKYITLRMPAELVADLRRVAAQEANSASAVARRLIAKGLTRELVEREAEAR
jgi:hypothetical protein